MAAADADLARATGLTGDNRDDRERADTRHLRMVTAAGLAMGLTAIVLIARQEGGATFASIAASGLALGAGAALIGALLGFLFGIPNTGLPGAALSKRQATGGTDDGAANYTPNTALEEISDWLTKILVGVGLTQLLAIRGAMAALASRLNEQKLPGVGLVALTMYFAVFGFIVGYAWTRVVLAPMFKRADLRLRVSEIVDAVHQSKQRLDTLVKQGAQANAEVVSNQMAAGLYDPQNPVAYQQAIREADALLQTQGDPKTFTFWSNLAAAHGQRAEAAKLQQNQEEFQAARHEALDAARKAISYDTPSGTAKGWIRTMLDGSVPEENDLVVFKGDPEFQALVK